MVGTKIPITFASSFNETPKRDNDKEGQRADAIYHILTRKGTLSSLFLQIFFNEFKK